MSGRNDARRVALQMLCVLDLNPDESREWIDVQLQQELKRHELVDFARMLIRSVRGSVSELDERIRSVARHWRVSRMAVTDRNAIRMGACEMELLGTPPAVVLNETVELAREFGSEQSAAFVNGILDKLQPSAAGRATNSPATSDAASGNERQEPSETAAPVLQDSDVGCEPAPAPPSEDDIMDRLIRAFEFSRSYCHKLADDIDDRQFAVIPHSGMNHPAWIIGHLTLVADMAVGLLGGERELGEAEAEKFGPGSVPSDSRDSYAGKSDLLAEFDRHCARLSDAAASATKETLDSPNRTPFLTDQYPTVGHLVAHVMTTHASLHLGQLSAWRRCLGLGSVMNV